MMGPNQIRLVLECVFRFYISLLTPVDRGIELDRLGLTNSVDLSSIDDQTLKAANLRLRTILRSP